jgi:hypothetical protein
MTAHEPPFGYVGADDLVEQSGATYRQVDYWTRTGHLRAINTGFGSGSRRWWPGYEVLVCSRMKALSDAGLLLAAAETLARTGALVLANSVRIEVAS